MGARKVNATLNKFAAHWLIAISLLTALPAWAEPRTSTDGAPIAAQAQDLRTGSTTGGTPRLAWDRVGAALPSVA